MHICVFICCAFHPLLILRLPFWLQIWYNALASLWNVDKGFEPAADNSGPGLWSSMLFGDNYYIAGSQASSFGYAVREIKVKRWNFLNLICFHLLNPRPCDNLSIPVFFYHSEFMYHLHESLPNRSRIPNALITFLSDPCLWFAVCLHEYCTIS